MYPATHLATVGEVIGERVVAALHIRLSSDQRARLARPDTSSPAAAERYVQGRALLVQHKDFDVAVQAFERAVALDPRYARAWAGLAHALARKYWHPESPEAARRYRARGKDAAEQALLIDPEAGGSTRGAFDDCSLHRIGMGKRHCRSQHRSRVGPKPRTATPQYGNRVLPPRFPRAVGSGEPSRRAGEP